MAQPEGGPMAPDVEKNLNASEARVSSVNSLAKDEAIAMVGDRSQDVDPVVVARAVRKTDWFLIPAMVFGCTSRPPPPFLTTLLTMASQMAWYTTTKPSWAPPSSSA